MKEFSEIELKQAKGIDIVNFLRNKGIEPNQQNNANALYCSPLRTEKTPSFRVSKHFNSWIDYGTGQRGDIVELVKLLQGISFVEAVKTLLESKSFSFICPNSENKEFQENKPIEIKAIKPLSNKALIQYLESRSIDSLTASKYLKEIYYLKNDKNYFGIAMQNLANGYEVRNQYSKICLLKKDISVFDLGFDTWSIFEGMFDFLSALIYWQMKGKQFESNVIVLHSVNQSEKAIQFLKEISQNSIYLFLDNDEQGKTHTKIFQSNFQIKDCSFIYQSYKDFNEFIVSKTK